MLVKFILNASNPFHLRRMLTLYLICFKFKDCLFCFEKDRDGEIKIASRDNRPKKYLKSSYLKDWLEWVINVDADYLGLPFKKEQRTLRLRKNKEQA